jgi:hypothetical protein
MKTLFKKLTLYFKRKNKYDPKLLLPIPQLYLENRKKLKVIRAVVTIPRFETIKFSNWKEYYTRELINKLADQLFILNHANVRLIESEKDANILMSINCIILTEENEVDTRTEK